jgi:hypothetical protein
LLLLERYGFVHKEANVVYGGNAQAIAAMCTDIGDPKGEKVTGSEEPVTFSILPCFFTLSQMSSDP